MNTDDEILYRGRFLQIQRQDHWEYVSRVNASGAVHILALTAERDLLLVEQYRPPVGAAVLELPAGLVGDDDGGAGETPEQAAARELVEETGYRPRVVERLVQGPSSPGMAAELTTLVRARGLTRVSDGGGISDENITVHHVPVDAVRGWLESRLEQGWLIDHKVYAALYFLDDD